MIIPDLAPLSKCRSASWELAMEEFWEAPELVVAKYNYIIYMNRKNYRGEGKCYFPFHFSDNVKLHRGCC